MWGGKKLIMIMIITIIYIFFILYDIWLQLKITFAKSSAPPPKKIHSSLFTHSPPKNSKIASLPLFAYIENFLGSPAERRGRTLKHLQKFLRVAVERVNRKPVNEQLALGWQIAKQFSGLNPLLLSNNKSYSLKKSKVFPL